MYKHKSTCFLLILITLLISCETKEKELDEREVKEVFNDVEGKTLSIKSIPKYKVLAPQSSEDLGTLSQVDNTCNLPTRISELTDGTEFNLYKFDKDQSAEIKAMGFTSSVENKELLFIEDFVRYKIVTCNGSQTRVGIGLRCFIKVSGLKAKLAGSLPAVAANVQLGKAKANFQLRTLGFGIDGKLIAQALKGANEYNVENFGQLAVIFNNVLNTLNDENQQQVSPVSLPLVEEAGAEK